MHDREPWQETISTLTGYQHQSSHDEPGVSHMMSVVPQDAVRSSVTVDPHTRRTPSHTRRTHPTPMTDCDWDTVRQACLTRCNTTRHTEAGARQMNIWTSLCCPWYRKRLMSDVEVVVPGLEKRTKLSLRWDNVSMDVDVKNVVGLQHLALQRWDCWYSSCRAVGSYFVVSLARQ